MLGKLLHALMISVAIVSAFTLSPAQRGGKAEPMRIEFKHGTFAATVSDKISGSEEAEYVIAARKGQRLKIHLTSLPRKSSVFDLKAPDDADLGLEYDANYDYSGVLPVTGDYLITVVRPTTSPGKSTYKFVISLR